MGLYCPIGVRFGADQIFKAKHVQSLIYSQSENISCNFLTIKAQVLWCEAVNLQYNSLFCIGSPIYNFRNRKASSQTTNPLTHTRGLVCTVFFQIFGTDYQEVSLVLSGRAVKCIHSVVPPIRLLFDFSRKLPPEKTKKPSWWVESHFHSFDVIQKKS